MPEKQLNWSVEKYPSCTLLSPIACFGQRLILKHMWGKKRHVEMQVAKNGKMKQKEIQNLSDTFLFLVLNISNSKEYQNMF